MDKYSALKQYFGHTAFRPGQEQLVDGILSGRDALGIMPTGGGKSLCYQIPALLLPGVTLVVSPLISLMKDQVAALTSAGIPAVFVNSSLSLEEAKDAWSSIRRGRCRLIYAAPERLLNERFADLLSQQNLSLAAVDEAHCISQWGQDFRPSYLKIVEFVDKLPRRPVVAAFTATATAQVQEDIAQRLALRDPVKVVTGFDRPNLFFDVRKPPDKLSALIDLVEQRPGSSGIVYCSTRPAVEEVCQALCRRGIPATRYHAGLSEEERRRNQDDFQYDRKTVMAATNAFGMGIDKSNVSFVIHYNMPKNLESYYQEAGRAGRDGEPADCILLFAEKDVATAKFLIDHSAEESELTGQELAEVRRQDQRRLNAMVGYCKTTECLRGCILRYFGQAHPPECGNCGSCRGAFTEADITTQAQMILSCIQRVKDRLGYYVGAALIMQVLRGSKNQRVLTLGLDSLSTYGLLSQDSEDRLRKYLDCLTAQGYIFTEPEHATLRLAPEARNVLFRGERVTMRVKMDRKAKTTARAPSTLPVDDGLLDVLKAVRTRLAQIENVPAYVVFSNAVLTELASRKPRTIREFLKISGVGEVKASRYGEAFLSAIEEYDSK